MKPDWLEKYNLITYNEIDSTNSEALRIADSNSTGNCVILSRTQTGGRGTKGKHWCSLEGNLHASILLKTQFDLKRNSQLSFVAANALFEAINSLACKASINPDIKLKWPNDVLVNSKKIAGILLESISKKDTNYIIIGIGVNIERMPDIDKPVSSLKDIGIEVESTVFFLNVLMAEFVKLYCQWKNDGNFVRTRKEWMHRAYNLNKPIVIDNGNCKISGIFKGIDLEGAMRLQLASGQYCNIVSGEVLLRDDI